MHKTVKFPRAKLFDLAWEKPLLDIAVQIGVSDVAVAKACRRANIPLPGRGYWAKRPKDRAKKPTLPPITDRVHAEISFTVVDPEAFRLSKKAQYSGELIHVPAELVDPHPLVALTAKVAKRATPVNGVLPLRSKTALSVVVTPPTFDRALLILDALIKACVKLGYQWRVSSKGKTLISCDGYDIEVHLKEQTKRRELPPPPPKNRSLYWAPTKEYEWLPTNILVFAIENEMAGGARRSWGDGKTASLEEKLHEIVAGLPNAVAGIKALQDERDEFARRLQEDAERRRNEAWKAEETRQLRQILTTAVGRWNRAEQIRALCERVEQRARATSEQALTACEPWLAWARSQADLLDPSVGDVTEWVTTSIEMPEHFTTEHHYYQRRELDWWGE